MSLGFDTKDSFVEMRCAPAADLEEAVRSFTEADLPAIERLSKKIYKVNRVSDLKALSQIGGHALVRDHGDGLTGYLTLGLGVSHGVAETEGDALALIGELALRFPEEAKFNCPLSNGSLYRKALKAGCRAIEMHTLMALGPYEQPDGIWMPSEGY